MRTLFLLGLLSAAASSASAAWIERSGEIDAVTVYRGQALVTRQVELEPPAGLNEVIVTGLPPGIVAHSLHAEADGPLEIRSVQFRQRLVDADPREDVAALNEQLQSLRQALDTAEAQGALLEQFRQHLEGLSGYISQTAVVETSHGVLDVGVLRELTTFLFERREAVLARRLELQREQQRLNQEISLLEARRQHASSGKHATVREAVVAVDARGPARLFVRYLVDAASWAPTYNVRATDGGEPTFELEYAALIHQATGENWDDVRLTLSTATPTLTAEPPTLAQLAISLSARTDIAREDGISPYFVADRDDQSGGRISELNAQLESLDRERRARGPREQRGALARGVLEAGEWGLQQQLPAASDELNALGAQLQLNELALETWSEGKSRQQRRRDESLSVTYALTGRRSLPSRSDRQLVQISEQQLGANVYKVATPLLTSYVYNEAALTNTTANVLLAGPVAAYLNGEFVGRGALPTVAAGEQFTVGLGADPRLRARRVLSDKDVRIEGGNKVVTQRYDLHIENFSGDTVAVRIKDRLPVVERGADIRFSLLPDSPEPARLVDGIAEWQVDAPPTAGDGEPFALSYGFTLEYDRNRTVVGLANAAR